MANRGLGRVGAGSAVTGVDDLLDFLENRFPAAVVDEMTGALNDQAGQLVDYMKANAPVGLAIESHPGELRDSIHVEAGRHPLQVRVVEDAGLGRGDPYAAPVEFGHNTVSGRHVPAVPHFWPSVRQARRPLQAAIAKALRRAVVKAKT